MPYDEPVRAAETDPVACTTVARIGLMPCAADVSTRSGYQPDTALDDSA